MTQKFTDIFKEAMQCLEPPGKVYIAYSGGLDSQTLLHAVSYWAQTQGIELIALHLNHGLSSNANDWQAFCEQQCKELGVHLLCKTVALNESPAGNLEQRARDARYTWFKSKLDTNDVLLMAHHRDDQAETVVLRLLRGSGVRGLAAIPCSRGLGKGRLLRPFLDISKAELRHYAERHELSWIEDESNYSTKFDRNYIRHEVMPALSRRWSDSPGQLARSARNCRDEARLLDELAAMDASAIESSGKKMWLEVLRPLDLAAFQALSLLRQRNVLQYLLRPIIHYPVPGEQMNEWLRQVGEASKGAQAQLTLEELTLVLHDGSIHFTCPVAPGLSATVLDWQTDTTLSLPQHDCEIRLVEQSKPPVGQFRTLLFEPGETVRVHWRQGGERVQLQGEPFSRSLKKLFQEKRVAPWLRQFMPLVSVEGYIVWSAALGDFAPSLLASNGRHYTFELIEKG